MSIEGKLFEQPKKEGEKLEKFKDMILTSEQYKDTPFAHDEDARSHVFKLLNGDKSILYFGSSHTNNPNDQIFEEIQKKFEETKPDIVYIEGLQSVNQRKNTFREGLRNKSIEDTKLDGENNFTLKLAVDYGIDFESPEPNFSQEILYLLTKGFSKKDIFTFFIYRDIDQYQRQNEKKSTDECKRYLEPYLKEFRINSGWEKSELDALEQEILVDLSVDDMEKYNTQVDPIPWDGEPQTVLNEISRNSSDFRDRYIFERIAEGLKKYDKLFVVYGSAHAVKQEPALRALLSKN